MLRQRNFSQIASQVPGISLQHHFTCERGSLSEPLSERTVLNFTDGLDAALLQASQCATITLLYLIYKRWASVDEVSVVGVDLAKQLFQVTELCRMGMFFLARNYRGSQFPSSWGRCHTTWLRWKLAVQHITGDARFRNIGMWKVILGNYRNGIEIGTLPPSASYGRHWLFPG